MALAAGCEVFTTAGNEEKRRALKERYPQLQDKHLANSRTTDFEWSIRQVGDVFVNKDKWVAEEGTKEVGSR